MQDAQNNSVRIIRCKINNFKDSYPVGVVIGNIKCYGSAKIIRVRIDFVRIVII